jgi:hypothetical protein
VGFPQRRETAQIDPGRRSPNAVIWRKMRERSASKAGKESGMEVPVSE